MKYIIDVEKIEGTNLWKAKEFNTLVFDEHGLNKLIDCDTEVVEDLKKENRKLWKKVANEKFERIQWQHSYEYKERELNGLKKEIEEHNSESEVIDFLRGENEMLRNQLKDKEKKYEKLYSTMVVLAETNENLEKKIKELEDKLPCEGKVPIEEVVETDTVMTNADKFKKVFGYYATEMWAKEEREFLAWNYSKYKSIDDEYIELIKKAEPQKPYVEGDGYSDGKFVYDTCICETCDTLYELEDFEYYKYCPECGQKIDLSWIDDVYGKQQ